MYSRTELIGITLIGVVALYLLGSMWTFAFRHPWMTDTERLLHLPDALMWRQLPRQ